MFFARSLTLCFSFFFFNDTATTEIYTLSLHDAHPISGVVLPHGPRRGFAQKNHRAAWGVSRLDRNGGAHQRSFRDARSGEHTSGLQAHSDIVCRLLLVKKKKKTSMCHTSQQ